MKKELDEIVINDLQEENQLLKKKIEIQLDIIKLYYEKVKVLELNIKLNDEIHEEKVKCFKDDKYFKGLNYEQISELAKKSLRMTDETINLKNCLFDIEEFINSLDTWNEAENVRIKKMISDCIGKVNGGNE